MAISSNDDVARKIASLQGEFQRQIPENISDIGRLWDAVHLRDDGENSLIELHRIVHNMAGSAGTFGAFDLGKTAREMEKVLKQFVNQKDAVLPLSNETKVQVEELFTMLRQYAEELQATSAEEGQNEEGIEDIAGNLLYAADDMPLESSVVDCLEQAGFIIRQFDQLTDFEAACEKELPLVIVMGFIYKSSDVAGADMISKLRTKAPGFPPVVFISDNDGVELRLKAVAAGGRRFFCKPFEAKQFTETVSGLTARAKDNSYRVLLADDDEVLLDYNAGILREAGMIVKTLKNPLEGLKVLEDFKPDVTVLDVYMPGCTGPALAQVIRQDDKWALMPIIFLSVEADISLQMESMNLGGDGFLVKPVKPDHLVGAIVSKAKRSRGIQKLNSDLQLALRESRFQLTTMDEHDIVSVADIAGNITEVNDKFCAISGYSRSELLGKSHSILKSNMHPAKFYDDLWNTISNGRVWHGKICNRKKNGSYYWVESTIVPFLDEQGKPYKYVSARTDITELRESEERLHRSQIFANIGNWDWDVNSDKLYWSDNIWALFGFENNPEDTSTNKFFSVIHPADKKYIAGAVNDCVENGSDYNVEFRVVWPDGSVHWLHDTGNIIRGDDGSPLHMLGVVQDINERKTAELALTERERQLREAQSLARFGNWEANMMTGDLIWSDEIYRIFGFEPGSFEPSVEAFRKAVHPDDIERVLKSEKDAEESGYHDVEHRIIWPDGSVRHVHERAQATLDEEGKVVRLAGTVQDITDRVENEAHFSFAIEGAGDGVWNLDMQTGEMEVSDLFFDMLGYQKGELPSHIDTWVDYTHPDDIVRVQNHMRDYLNGNIDKYSVELRLLCKDGSYKWVQTRGTAMSRSKDGRAMRMAGVQSDISERVALEEQLSRQRELLDMLHQSTTDFVVKGDIRATMDSMLNSLLKLTGSEYGFTGEVFHDEDDNPYLKTHSITNIAWSEETKALYNETIENGFEFRNLNTLFGEVMTSGECVISNDPTNDPRAGGLPEGHPAMHAFLGTPIFYGTELIGMYGLANRQGGYDDEILQFLHPFDSSYSAMIQSKRMMERDRYNRLALIEAKDEAENANRAKSQFLSSMSHELRTPMNAIMGFGQLLKMETDPPLSESQEENVQEIVKAGKHLLGLINEVLDLARIESGRIDLSIETVVLSEVISECLQLIAPLAQNRNITISILRNNIKLGPKDLAVQHDAVRADRVRLKQSLLNLLSNGVKYNSENGQLTIGFSQEDEELTRLSVIDTGQGLTLEQQGQLFRSFNRLGKENSEVEGSGVGLVITKSLIELMGGKIGVESTIGEGTTFWVELPTDFSPVMIADPDTDEGVLSNMGTETEYEHTVLYVEDNPANLRLVAQLLGRRSNIRLWSAHEPLLGLDLAAEHRPDLILLDINLPGMDGFDVLKLLRQREGTKDTPVFAVSANAMPKDIEKGMAAGFDEYITKPIDIKTLLQAIEKVLLSTESEG